MPKIYQEKPESDELFLRLRDNGFDDGALLRIVTDEGQNHADGVLCKLTSLGIFLPGGVSDDVAARAGFSPNALDKNGRLKVIGQGDEVVEAGRLERVLFQSAMDCHDGLIVDWADHGTLDITVLNSGNEFAMNLSPADIRDLAARLNRHVAYLDKEGLE